MLAKRKMRSRDLVPLVGITEQNISLLRSGKIKDVRFDTLERICSALNCQPGDLLEYVPDAEKTSLDPVNAASDPPAL